VATASRLTSIDMLRGFVMVLMALDHVRDMLTRPPGADPASAADFSGAEAALFFTRWITHLCAPTFVLLAGVGAHLYGSLGRRTTADVARFLASRGLWLVAMELTVVNLAWSFNLHTTLVLQVIWAIGACMVAMAGLVWLPRSAIAAIGAALVAGHNLLDGVQPTGAEASLPWRILHQQGPVVVGGERIAFVVYPLLPWLGVMALGFAMGPWFARPDPARPRRLAGLGALLVLGFLVLRAGNLTGEPVGWAAQANPIATLIAFLNTTKYPPSLQYLLMTLGPALLLLGGFERLSGRVAGWLVTIGRVPFFYYVVHLYVIHAIAVGVGLAQGFRVRDVAVLFLELPAGFGIPLGAVYVLWALVVAGLYPACAWFAGVKARRREWWIRYL
jgi:uncharacterized membrane protein